MRPEDSKSFEIALLIENVAEAKQISDALREIGIFAHYYSDLDEFWVAANAQTPDFLILDVKRMSQGSTLFKNHPKVQNGSLAFGFYYSEETKVLANSTFQFNHYGLIKKELNLLGQLRAALRRRNEELRLIDKNAELEERTRRLQTRANRILKDTQESCNFQRQFQAMMNLTSRVGKAPDKRDFLNRLTGLFSDWDACLGYGVYALNASRQKLTSPKTIKKKYEALPDLWLTRPGQNGIDLYAQEMACEVAFDFFENDARAIAVKGTGELPEIMLIGKFDETSLRGFPWELLEERLSSAYVKISLEERAGGKESSKLVAFWEAFAYMDDMHFHQAEGLHRVADIDLAGLTEAIEGHRSNRFFWKSFCSDFIASLERNLSGDFKISAVGPDKLLVFIDKNRLEEDFAKLKSVCAEFPYWRYFQDASLLMTKAMRPNVRLAAPSSYNFISSAVDLSAPQEAAALSRGFRRPSLEV